MGRVTKRPAAEADLIDLRRYIAADNPDKADEALLAIEQKCFDDLGSPTYRTAA